ncbi:MAG: hypothetical protein C0402_00650 [Thermodesulfovibrio sp.]|nr:hypothetical protein [Thermodesulfovibrio sp.]
MITIVKGDIMHIKVSAFCCSIILSLLFSSVVSASPGSIDLSFGTAGKVKTDFNSSSDQATASAIYTAGTHAGKIVVAGMVMNASNYDTFGVARYNANGTLDTTFDTDGKAPTVDLTGYFSRPWGVAIQSDDKIVVVGAASWGSPTNRNDLGVVRYNANGSLDTTFDGDGKVTMQIGSLNSSWQAVAIQSDGKILIAGQSYSGGDVSTIVRLNTNGSYDTSFTISAGGTYESFNAVAVQSDGKIVAAGYGYDGSNNKMTVVRLTSAGALDTSFNGSGIQLLSGTKAFGTGGESANSLALQSDGKILVGGTTDVSGQNAFAVARLNTDGSLDTSFNTTGKVILDPTTGSDSQKGIGVQSDGKIVLSGYGTGPSGNYDFIAARLNAGGTVDTSFGSSGYVFIDFGDDDRGDAGLVIQSDNNSVIAGWSSSGAARDFALVRLNASSTNMVYASSTVAQNTNVIAPGATGDIVNIAITMNGDLSALTATSFTCNTTGTTAPADISSARLYYTGTTAAFSTATPFGSAVASPSGSFTITGTQALTEGTNYFWLAYAVSPGATNGNVLDAQCTSVTVGGSARTPSVTAPAGNRQIFNILAIYDIGTHIPVQSGGPNYVVPGSVASGITATNLTAGPSMTTDTFYTGTGSYLFMNWTTSTSNDAGQYFQARITPDALKQITYNRVAFSVAADNYPATPPTQQFFGPTTIDLRYSTDDFASSNVLIQTLTWTPTGTFEQVPFDVDISSIGTRSGPITFRWYGYKRNAAGDLTSTMGFTNLPAGGQAAASGTGSNIILKGTVSSTNTAPTFVGAVTTLTVNQNASATDIKGLLHVSDTDSSQTETWMQSVAPNHGGTLSFSSATAASGSADITPGGTITYQPAAGYSGTETFTVQVSDGTATATRTITVTIVPPPTVTSISPTSGPVVGGTAVTITGTSFTGATAVMFGGAAATGVTVVNSTTITATSPAGSAGTVDVTVTTPSGTSVTSSADQFTYAAAPTVTGISPTSGPTVGGTSVTITGTNFTGATSVTFAGFAATGVTVVNATTITATTPAHAAGLVDVAVTTPGGTSATSASDQFTYIPAPTVISISPTSGPLAGGTSVTITGTNFTGATAVRFGSTAAASFTINSATQITATSPAGTGTADVTVTTSGGTSATSSADQFTYIPAPTVTSISPTSGSTSGGTSVSITGTNFTGATAVRFGSTAAASFTVNSAIQITAVAPAGSGTVDIIVTTLGGTSATSSADLFTYCPGSITVVSSSDSGPGTLRQAMSDICADGVIDFDAGLAGQTITLSSTFLIINKNMTINGLTSSPGIDISGGNTVGVFFVYPGVTASLNNLTIKNGSDADRGGGINNQGTLTVTDSVLSGNYAGNYGGGIANYVSGIVTLTNTTLSDNSVNADGGGVYNQGTLTMTNSIISGNSSATYGGGIDNEGSGALTMTNSTLSGNTTAYGGGIFNRGSVSLTNSTLSGNSALQNGGGIENAGSVTMTNSTISGNSANIFGGGILNNATLTITNSIIASNSGAVGPDVYGSINSQGYNLIGAAAGTTINGDTTGNIIGVAPLLSPLGNYGGPTQTMALLPGSPAIDAGTNSGCPTTDQRGMTRPYNTACDIGAVESRGFTLTISGGDNQSAVINTSFASDLAVTVNANDPGVFVDGGLVTFIAPGSGASASITGSPATISGGTATVNATANGIPGSYTVTASAGGPGSVSFNLTNAATPDTTIDTKPSNPSGSASALFSFSGSGGLGTLSFECELDSGGFSACTSPKGYSPLGEGSHTFQVRSVDSVGNKDATPASYTWVVDTIPPDTSITSNPSNPTNSTSASFSFTGNDGSGTGVIGFECSLDSGPFSVCISPASYSGLSSAGHTFQVRAVDAAGNADTAPESYTWVIDATPPDTSITSNPSNPTNSTSASFSFTGNDGSGTGVVGFECSLDSGSFSVCTSPASYSGLSSTGHTFQVSAVDAVGNKDATPASYTWTIDAVLPTVDTFTVTSPTVSLDIAITAFTASDAGGVNGYMITQSSTPPAANDAGWSGTPLGTYTVGGGGSYTFYPWARDTAGNVSTVFGSPRVVSVCYPSITVGNNADSGDGSLRQAIADICPDGTINFNGDYTISLASTLAISKNVTIDGDGHSVTVSGNSQCIVFMVSQSIAFNLNNVTVADGHGPSSGGIYNYRGTVTVTNSTFSSNTATAATPGGGAICNYGGTLTVTNSTFSSNTTYDSFCSGGAICNDLPAAVLTVTGSTFSANTAPYGGGIRNNGGTVTVTDSSFLDNNATTYGGGLSNNIGTVTVTGSTFSGNSASYAGGGISNGDALTVTNSTFSGNSVSGAGGGGGIYNGSNEAMVTVTNSTFSDNSATGTLGGGIHILLGTATMRNTVLWGNTGGEIIGSATVSASVVQGGGTGSNIIVADPLLGPLGSYGGSTQTIPLLPGSAAMRGTNTNCPATDQRGVTRGASCDIGAFESRGFSFGTPTGTPQSTPFSTPFATPLGVTVTSDYGEPVDGGVITFAAPSSGASITASSSQATIAGGAVSLNVTANGTIGTYQVTASASGIALPAIFDLSNGLATQSTLFLSAPSDLTIGTSATLSTTGGSGGGAVTYQVTAGSCHVLGDQLTADASTGVCTITATKAADATYSEAVSAPATVTLHPLNKIAGTVVSGPGSGTNECTPADVAYGGSFTCTLTPSKGYDLYGLYDNSINWTGSVSVIGNHYSYTVNNVTLDHTVKANFANYPVIILNGVNSDCKVSLTSAAAAASVDGDRIQAQALTFTGDLNFAHPGIAVSLEGGYDSGFSNPTGNSVIRGSVTISDGAVTVENITIR